METIIRKATAADIDAICTIYEHIHAEQERKAVNTGWIRDV